MRNRILMGAALSVALLLLRGVPARALQVPDSATVTILSPKPTDYLTGPTTLKAAVEPKDAVALVTFFVDGRQVCSLSSPPWECDYDSGVTISHHQVRVVATYKAGGRKVDRVDTKSLDYAERVDVDVVQLTVTVSDGHGKFISGIPESAFHVSEDSKAQKITHFSSLNVPLELIVAIDVSGSMTPAMPRVKTAVKQFLGEIPARDLVTLLGFNEVIFPLTRSKTDPVDRIKAVDRLAPWGSTALYDVILRGIEMLGTRAGRKALVIFTDGEDQGSKATIGAVERRLQSSDVTLYMIGQGRGVQLDALKRVMERLAEPTGGRAFFTDSADELHDAFSALLDELSNQYLLGYVSTNTKRDDSWRRIKVDVDGQHDVRTRQGYRLQISK
jgi:Ca-activated chloride channel family protein